MKVAIISSEGLRITLKQFARRLPEETTEIILGGESEVESVARKHAAENNIKLTELFLEAEYGWCAPLIRNIKMIYDCDLALVFWDKKCFRAKFIMKRCTGKGIPCHVFHVRT